MICPQKNPFIIPLTSSSRKNGVGNFDLGTRDIDEARPRYQREMASFCPYVLRSTEANVYILMSEKSRHTHYTSNIFWFFWFHTVRIQYLSLTIVTTGHTCNFMKCNDPQSGLYLSSDSIFLVNTKLRLLRSRK